MSGKNLCELLENNHRCELISSSNHGLVHAGDFRGGLPKFQTLARGCS